MALMRALPLMVLIFLANPIFANGEFGFSVITIDETCNLDNGEIFITITGDTTGVEFSLDGIDYFRTTHFENLPSGDYLVFARSPNCVAPVEPAQIARAPLPTVSIVSECLQGFNLVSITPMVEGGITPFTYSWEGPNSNGSTSEILNMVEPGEYSLTITDRLGCTFSDTLLVDQCCALELECDLDAPVVSCENTFPEVNPVLLDPNSDNELLTMALSDLGITINSGQCGGLNVSVVESEDLPTNCNNDTLYVNREYIISDSGSDHSCLQRLKVANALPIGIDAEAASITVSCDDDIQAAFDNWIASHGGMEFTACSPDSVSLSTIPDMPLLNDGCNEMTEVTFMVVDQCGNSLASIGQFFTSDDESPQINCPENLELLAEDPELEETIAAWRNSVTAIDNCSQPNSFDDFSASLANPCELNEIVVQFVAMDNCENISDCTRTINVISETDNLQCPTELVINCGDAEIDARIISWLSEANSSIGNTISNDFVGLSSDIGCDEPTEVNFSTDTFCDGLLSCLSTIRIIDEQRPEIYCPQILSVTLGEDDLSQRLDTWLLSAEAQDCNTTTISNDFNLLAEDFECSDELPVAFTAVDACGLTNSCTSMIFVENNSDISIICPEPITVICSDPELALIIESHANNISVQSTSDYEISHVMSNTPEEISCENVLTLELETIAIDVCNSEASCFTAIDILPDPQIYIPNVFTPDNDGLNDWFTVYSNESVYVVSSLRIYDRWGSLVFEAFDFPTNEDQEGWDGRIRNIVAADNVFTYHAMIIDSAGNQISRAGTVQILKKSR